MSTLRANNEAGPMTIAELMVEISRLSIDERIELTEAIWESIAADPAAPALTDAQREELARRIEDHRMNPDDVIPWEAIKAEALARLRR